MSLIGFLFNIKEGVPPNRDFSLFRIASMDEVLRPLGAQLFVYSPRQIDPETGEVTGLVVEDGRFVPHTAPVPEVNGSWYIGSDRSSNPTMDAHTFRTWIADHGIEVYPLHAFSRILKDKYKTYRLVRDLDPALHPYTELYDNSLEQLERFVQRYRTVFVKPRFGSKGDDIFSVKRVRDGFECAYYLEKQKQAATHATVAEALAAINATVGDKQFLIQRGVPIARHNDAPFILRVILLDDGNQWQWVHKAVLAAPGSDIANTTQGGSNWTILDLLTTIHGADQAGELFEEVRRVSFDFIHHLDRLFPGKLMEVAFDFALSKRGQLQVLEINTLPGMTKPGLPPEPAFRDIMNRQPSEREAYEKFVLPHGSCLARFLHTKLAERKTRTRRRETRAALPDSFGAGVTAPEANAVTVDRDAPRLDQAIARQAQHLVQACLVDGSFRYRDDVEPTAKVDPRFHVLRHVEAMYAFDLYDQWRPDAAVREAALRAGHNLKTNYVAPIPDEEHLLAVWSRSEFNYLGAPDQVKLGWTGLGLVALLGLERHSPGFTPLEELRALGEFIRWAQNEDGGFRSLFVPSQGGWKSGWKSVYYPGEAALGLLMLHELDPSRKWVQAAADAIGYLVRTRDGATRTPPDHWALLATARLLPVFDDCEPTVSRGAVVRHAKQICKSILCEQIWNPANPIVDGGFTPNGLTEPTAVRLQGLLAMQTFLTDQDGDLADGLRTAIREGAEFLVRACVPDGSEVIAMPRAIAPLPEGSAGSEAFNRRVREVSLDSVQPALCALIQYAQVPRSALVAEDATPDLPKPPRIRGPGRAAAGVNGRSARRAFPTSRAETGDKLLFTPGPLTTSIGVKRAMLRDLGSRDAEFLATVRGIRDGLLRLAGVSQKDGFEAIPMQGSGTFAIESVVSSAVPRDGRLLVVSNGAYGERIAAIASACQIDTEVLRFPEDALPDPAVIDRALAGQPGFTHIAVVHCETSTGMVNPVGEIGAVARKHGCSYVIDSMSAFGALPVYLDGWGVDFLVSSANKCIEGVPGFGFVLCRRAALESIQGRARSFSLDLFAQWQGLQANGQFRFTPPTHALAAFATALEELEAEGGVGGRGARYRNNHACLVQGMRRLGFSEYLPPELQGPIITSFRFPEDPAFDFAEFYRHLNARGFVIYPGKVSAAECFRIGTIGRLFEQDVKNLLSAVEATVREMGITSLRAPAADPLPSPRRGTARRPARG